MLFVAIFLTAFGSRKNCLQLINCQNASKPAAFRLRSFMIHSMKTLVEFRKFLELQEKLREEKLMKEQMEKKKIIQKYLDAHVISSQGFLKDFHTIRFQFQTFLKNNYYFTLFNRYFYAVLNSDLIKFLLFVRSPNLKKQRYSSAKRPYPQGLLTS